MDCGLVSVRHPVLVHVIAHAVPHLPRYDAIVAGVNPRIALEAGNLKVERQTARHPGTLDEAVCVGERGASRARSQK